MVFAHGWPDSSFSFNRVLPLLPDTFRAVVFDQRGFGDSDKPESGYTIPEMADDLVAVLDALAIPSATIVGHSFGSFVARRTDAASPHGNRCHPQAFQGIRRSRSIRAATWS